MPSLYVVYDSNVYRGLSGDAYESIRAAERGHSVVGLASKYVAAELLSHISAVDSARASAFAGICRLYSHCTFYDGSRYLVRFLADTADHIAFDLFGKRLPGGDESAEYYGQMIGIVAAASPADALVDIELDLHEISGSVAAEEERFVRDMWTRIVEPINPNAKLGNSLIGDKRLRKFVLSKISSAEALRRCAEMFVRSTAVQAGVMLTEDVLSAKATILQDRYPVGLRLYNAVVRRIIRDGCDLTNRKRGNWLWDINIAFATGPDAYLNGAPIWLITDDKDVLSAAVEAGAEHRVQSLAAYQSLLAEQTRVTGMQSK